jgi:hypothetical protein
MTPEVRAIIVENLSKALVQAVRQQRVVRDRDEGDEVRRDADGGADNTDVGGV